MPSPKPSPQEHESDQVVTSGANGVTVKIPGTKTEFSASETSVATIEKGYENTLRWAHDDKPEFFTLVGLAALALVLRTARKITESRMKIDFDKERQRTQEQGKREVQEPKLPFDRSP